MLELATDDILRRNYIDIGFPRPISTRTMICTPNWEAGEPYGWSTWWAAATVGLERGLG